MGNVKIGHAEICKLEEQISNAQVALDGGACTRETSGGTPDVARAAQRL